MVRCLLSWHSKRSCVHSGLRHLLFRQLWVCQKHAAADLRDQVRDGNICLILFLFLHTFTSLPPSLFLLSAYTWILSISPYTWILCFISCMFLKPSFLQCSVITLKRRDDSVIIGCQHTGSFLHHLDPNQQKCLIFSSADCKGHLQKPIQKPQRLFASYPEQVWWWGLIVAVFGYILFLFDIIHYFTWYPYVKMFGKVLLEFIIMLLCERIPFSFLF